MSVEQTLKILVVEDDYKLAMLIKEYLEAQGFAVSVEMRGDLAAERILRENPDLVILDLMLPGEDGISICRKVRAHYNNPILILTARSDEVDEVVGLEVGADDYLSKPMRPRILLARIRNLLRRQDKAVPENDAILDNGIVCADLSKRTVSVNGKEIVLTTGEYDLLVYLLRHKGTPVTREDIYKELYGVEWDVLDRSIDLRIARLRKKIGDNGKFPQILKSVRGYGYLMVDEK